MWIPGSNRLDQLGLIGLMWGIPDAYLGLTILAWGNSVGDTITNASVAKRGLAKMAITGCFAG
jgi:sodium/potassium/calcium exchanger 6